MSAPSQGQYCQQIPCIDSVERSFKSNIVLARAWRVERKLHAAAISFGQQPIRDLHFAAVIFSDADNEPRSLPLTSSVLSETRPSMSGELSFLAVFR